MAAFKLSVGGRKLTLAECASVREEAKQERAAAEQEGGRKWQVWLDLQPRSCRAAIRPPSLGKSPRSQAGGQVVPIQAALVRRLAGLARHAG